MNKTNLKTDILYVVLGTVISGICIYCMIEPLNRQSKETMKKHLESPYYGPFDEAMAKTLGVEDKRTPPSLPSFDTSTILSKPLNLNPPKFKGFRKSAPIIMDLD